MNGERNHHHNQPPIQQQQQTTSAPLRLVDSGTLLSHSNSGTTTDTAPKPRHDHHDPTYLTSMPIASASDAVLKVTSGLAPSTPAFQIQQLVDPSDFHKLYSLQPGMNAPHSPPPSCKAAVSNKPPPTAHASTNAPSSSSTSSGVSKLKLHAADFAHRMDDSAVLRSRRDWSFVRDGWPAKASIPSPMVVLPVTKQPPNRRGGNGASATSFTANASDSNQAVASFLYVTCLPPGLIDLDPVARAQLMDPESSSNAKSRLVRESTSTPFQQQQQASANGSPLSNSPISKSRADAARKLARPPAAPASDPVLTSTRSRHVRPQSADAAGRRGTLAATTQVMTLPVYSPLSDADAQPHTPSPPPVAASDASAYEHSHVHPTRPSSAGSGSTSGFPARPRSAGLRGMLPLKRHGSGESTSSGSGGSSTSSSSGSIYLQRHHHHHHRHQHRSASPGYGAPAMSNNTTLYSPSRHMASGSQQPLTPSVNRLPGLRKLSSLFPGSNAAVLSSCTSLYTTSSSSSSGSQIIVQPTVPRAASNALTIDLTADMQSLGLSGTRCVSSSSPPPAAPSRAGFASASPTSSSPKQATKRPSVKPRNHRTAAAAVATLMHATPANTSVAAAAAAAAAIVQVAAADVIHAATVGGGGASAGAGGAGGGGGGGGGMASVGIGVSSKYNRMSALPRLEFARVKYAT